MIPASDLIAVIADHCRLSREQVQAAVDLLAGGATIPFIARYRKEATGSLDEVAVTAIRDQLHSLTEIARRRAVISESLATQGVLTAALQQQLEAATTLARLEDIYLPFRPKRRTRGMIAREKGLGSARLLHQGVDDAAVALLQDLQRAQPAGFQTRGGVVHVTTLAVRIQPTPRQFLTERSDVVRPLAVAALEGEPPLGLALVAVPFEPAGEPGFGAARSRPAAGRRRLRADSRRAHA